MSKLFGVITEENQNKLTDIAILALRVFAGLAMVYGHGFKKLAKLTGDDPIQFADPLGVGMELTLYVAILAEFVCASLIVIGLFTRWATIPLIITMSVAAFLVKMSQGFGEMELPLLYLFVFLAILLVGPRKYSLDHKLSGGN